MRKILFALIMSLLLIITGLLIVNGLNIGNLEIWGVKKIIAENDIIDSENDELSNLVSISYPASLKKLENTAKAMQTAKTEYESKAILFSDGSHYLQTEEYEIEFLWTKIGNYAKDNDVEIKIEVTSSQIDGRYDLNFTVVGKYADVTQFIYDIENDSKLGFKIEDFNMISSESGVQGMFSCKEIKIDISKNDIIEQRENTQNTESTGNTTETENKTANTQNKETNTTSDTNTTTNTETNTTTNTTSNTATNTTNSSSNTLDLLQNN